jgi:hypothetical protein
MIGRRDDRPADDDRPREASVTGKRDRYEPSDPRPAWGLSVEEFTRLTCAECGRPFEADAARGVKGGLVIVDDGGTKKYYHGYPERPQPGSCYSRAERKGFP